VTTPEEFTPPNPDSKNEQSADVARQLVKASFLLSAGNLIGTVVLIAASLLIARLLGPTGYGEFSLTLTLPSFFSLFVDFGAISAIQHFSAFYVSRGDLAKARRLTKNAIYFTVITGFGLSAAVYFSASSLAVVVLHRPDLIPYVQLASSLVISQALFTAITLAFIGWRAPTYSSGMYIVQSVLKLMIAPVLIVLGFGVLGAVTGHILSYSITAIIGMVAIFMVKLRGEIKKSDISQSSQQTLQETANQEKMSWTTAFVADVKEITSYGIPAYLGNGMYQFANNVFILFLLSAFVSNIYIGFYQAAYNVVQPIVMISNALGYSLFAAFSSLSGYNVDVRTPLRYSVTYVSLVLMPLILFVIGASNAIVVTFYGQSFAPSAEIFSYLGIAYLPGALGLTVFPSFLNGVGRTKLSLIVQMSCALTIFVLGPILEILGLHIFGAIYALIVGSLVSALVGTYVIKRYLGASIDFATAARIFLASDISLIAIFALQMIVRLDPIVTFVSDFIVFFGLYVTLIPAIRALKLEDFERLRNSSASLGSIGKIIGIFLRYEMYIVKKFSS
jgi:O-antigen/teichoic acid export membrane protein